MKAWKGVAFEQVCWQHITQIKRTLEIGGVKSSVLAWNIAGTETKTGTQVDLLINRNDNIVNLCEMKFYSGLMVFFFTQTVRLPVPMWVMGEVDC